jgi:hypothetical protein
MAQIAWYPLNDFDLPSDACDDINANDNDGTFNGTWNYREEGPLGAGAANVKSVRQESTSNDEIDIASMASLVGDEGTVMAWVKLPTGAVWGTDGRANGEGGIVHIANTAGTYDVLLVFGGITDDLIQGYAGTTVAQYNATLSTGIWYHFAVTWKVGEKVKLYEDGVLKASSSPNASSIAPFNDAGIGNTSLGGFGFLGNIAQVKVYDTELTAAEIDTESAIYLPLETSVRIPCPNLKLKELRQMWKDVERTHPETCTIQVSLDGTSFSTIYENVPCSLELTGTRQELNSADEYVTIQNWVVTISGRYLLPVAANFPTIRFVVENGLTIDGYTYYQSPCDIQTVIEGQLA